MPFEIALSITRLVYDLSECLLCTLQLIFFSAHETRADGSDEIVINVDIMQSF